MRQFSVGEVVTFIPDSILRSAAPGDYKIVSSMPDRDGDHMYRIKSPLRRARAGCDGKSSREIGWLFAGRSCTAKVAPTFDNPPVTKAVGGSRSSRADHVDVVLGTASVLARAFPRLISLTGEVISSRSLPTYPFWRTQRSHPRAPLSHGGASYGGGRGAKQKPRIRSGARWVHHSCQNRACRSLRKHGKPTTSTPSRTVGFVTAPNSATDHVTAPPPQAATPPAPEASAHG